MLNNVNLQQKAVVSLQSKSNCSMVDFLRIIQQLTTLQMHSMISKIICVQYLYVTNCCCMKRLLLLDFKTINTAAVSCVVKHEVAVTVTVRVSKQTRPSCRDRCSHTVKVASRATDPNVLHIDPEATTDWREDPHRRTTGETICYSYL